jgi:cytochrome c556
LKKRSILSLLVTIFLVILSATSTVSAQSDSDMQKSAIMASTLNPKVLVKLNKKYSNLDADITKKNSKALERMESKERKLNKKLSKIDSTKAKEVFGQSSKLYKGLKDSLATNTNKLQKISNYIPGLDSLQTVTKFLQGAGSKINFISPVKLMQLNQLNGSLQGVQQKLQSVTDIRKLLSERGQQLQQELAQYGMGNQLKGLKTDIYYYQQQINEYKALLHDDQKLEQKVLSIVRDLDVFKDFMSKNSMLASLFPMPANYGTAQALTGLQTRTSVQQLLQDQLGSSASIASIAGQSGSSGGDTYLQQQIQSAQGQLNQLKDKVNELGGGSSDIPIPDFKPNSQKMKSFLKRIELGFNIQSQKTNYLLPTTSDIALTAGYKMNDHATLGIGASYKLGWGNGYKNISLSNQGLGLRTYGEMKLKGSIWITAGYEQNFYPELKDKLDSLPAYKYPGWGNGWQASGLVGLSKKYKIGKKTGSFQLLWDFLSYSQVPRASAIKFRIGWTF